MVMVAVSDILGVPLSVTCTFRVKLGVLSKSSCVESITVIWPEEPLMAKAVWPLPPVMR